MMPSPRSRTSVVTSLLRSSRCCSTTSRAPVTPKSSITNATTASTGRRRTSTANRFSILTPTTSTTTPTTTAARRAFSTSPSSRHDAAVAAAATAADVNTVSPEEVSHFNALASSWWDPQGPSRILHLMNPLRHDFIRACRASVKPPPAEVGSSSGEGEGGGLRYLDIGCGGGIFAESAARLPTTASVTAIDPSPEVLRIARAHARRDPLLAPSGGRLRYVDTPIERLAPPSLAADGFEGGYDVVSVFEVLEHVASPGPFLDRCAPFVRPGGWLVMSTIARTWVSWFTTNLMAEDVLRIVPRGTHDWRKYVNPDELAGHFSLSREVGAGRGEGGGGGGLWEEPRCMGVVYVPGVGWREVRGSEKVGNYFFAVRRRADA